jgi:aminoglycoside phosphotransferase (APT) family kinase protein
MTDTAVAGSDRELDAATLRSYLTDALDEEVTGLALLDGALNVVVAISTASAEDAYVLRQPDKLREAAYMNSLDVEYRVLEGLADTAVPAPEPVLYCADESIFGGPFFAMTALEGSEIPLGSDPPERFQHPAGREALAGELIDTLAAIHTVEVERFDGVCDRWSAAEQVARTADRLAAVTEETGEQFPTLEAVGEWLRENAPAPGASPTSLVHGDYRPGNVLFTGAETPRITGVLDWETAMLGDPLTELGYLLLRWRDEGDPTPDLDRIEQRYGDGEILQELREDNEHGMAPFTARLGSPTRRELVAWYEARTGSSFDHERFHRAHAAFGLATVWADLHRHQVAAGADSQYPPLVAYMAQVADSIRRGEFAL